MKLLPGEPFDRSARTYSDLMDVVAHLRTSQLPHIKEPSYPHVYPGGTIVKVENLTGANIPWYGIVELRSAVSWGSDLTLDVLPFLQEPYSTGIFPFSVGSGVLGIAQYPINTGQVGEVLIDGISQVRLFIKDTYALNYSHASPVVGNSYAMQAGLGGQWKILWSEGKPYDVLAGNNGINWALVQHDPSRLFGFKLAVAHPGRGEMFKIYPGGWGSFSVGDPPVTFGHRWMYDTATVGPAIPNNDNNSSIDVISSGSYTGIGDNIKSLGYTIVITASNMFKWSTDGGVSWSEPVAITGSAQLLSNGVYITFGNPSGHTIGDSWTIEGRITWCIDWRYGVPYPGLGATGLGTWRSSYYPRGVGEVLIPWKDRMAEVVALDCEVPP